MNLIKRHYEKVILMALFVIFLGLMFVVQSVISESGAITEEDLKLTKRDADFVNEDPADERFDTKKRWEDSQLVWRANVSREGGENFSDFIAMFPLASCPHCSDLAREEERTETVLIPVTYFSSDPQDVKKCPQCKNDLLPAPVITMEDLRENASTESDKDNDSVPDELESQYGMDSNNPHDARYDNDGDGFSNIFEIVNKYDPASGESHPPYWWRLHIKAIRQIELPVRFMAINDNGAPDDKTKWLLQFNSPDRYGRKGKDGKVITRSEFLRIGRRMKIEGRDYVIDDVERRQRSAGEHGGSEGNADNKGMIDISRVFLTEVVKGGVKPDKLVMVVNQPAYSSDQRPVLVDTGDVSGAGAREQTLKIGDTISLYIYPGSSAMDSGTGTGTPRRRVGATYRLKSVNAEKKTIVMEEVKKKTSAAAPAEDRIFELTTERKIPAKMVPVKKENQTVEMPGVGDMPLDNKGVRVRR